MPVLAQDLRDAILQSAITGNFSSKEHGDSDVENLLRDINNEKKKLIEQGLIPKEKKLKPIDMKEVDIEVPSHWKLVRVQDISTYITDYVANGSFATLKQNTTTYQQEEYAIFVRTVDLSSNFKGTLSYIDEKSYNWLSKSKLYGGELILPNIGGSIGKSFIMPKLDKPMSLAPNSIMMKFSYDILNEFFSYIIQSPYGQKMLITSKGGTATPKFSKTDLRNMVIPITSIEEINRIIKKLNQIMPLIDEYEKFENQLVELKKKFPDDMKAAILQAAMEGKLTKQLKSDSSVDELLKSIQQEKELLIKEKKIKKEKPLAPISDDEIPFDIPNSWRWVRLGNIGNWRAGATPLKSNNNYYSGGTIPWLLTGDLNDDYIDDVPNRITKLALESTSVKLIPKGSVLIAMYGATIGKLGILNIDLTTNQACCACTTFSSISNLYLFYFLLSYRKQFISQGEGGAQPNISKEKITQTLIPIPPIEEQQRIVDKLDQLLPLCDALANLEQEVA